MFHSVTAAKILKTDRGSQQEKSIVKGFIRKNCRMATNETNEKIIRDFL